jgi:hypothetical protein
VRAEALAVLGTTATNEKTLGLDFFYAVRVVSNAQHVLKRRHTANSFQKSWFNSHLFSN